MSWWRVPFQKVEPGQQPTPVPDGLRVWTVHTTCGLLGGSLYGGYRGLQLANTSEPSPVPAHTRLHRAAIFFVRESILTGARVGLFVSTFSALALATKRYRCQDDPANYALAGGATCALFGGAVAGWFGIIPAAAFGTAAGGVGALLQNQIQNLIQVIDPNQHDNVATAEDRVRSSVNSLIDRYETQLDNHPAHKPHLNSSKVDKDEPSPKAT